MLALKMRRAEVVGVVAQHHNAMNKRSERLIENESLEIGKMY